MPPAIELPFPHRKMGLAMDPYLTLGVARHCTLEEVKQAYRTRVRNAHPDLGGDEASFIAVSEAYKRILEDLARRPALRSSGSAQDNGRNSAPGPDDERDPAGGRPSPYLQDRDRTPRHPDPLWIPDLILMDHPDWIGHPTRPPDPEWDPELILMVDDFDAPGVAPPQGPTAVPDPPLAWRSTDATQAAHRALQRSNQERALGIVLLLCLILLVLFTLLHLFWHGSGIRTT